MVDKVFSCSQGFTYHLSILLQRGSVGFSLVDMKSVKQLHFVSKLKEGIKILIVVLQYTCSVVARVSYWSKSNDSPKDSLLTIRYDFHSRCALIFSL